MWLSLALFACVDQPPAGGPPPEDAVDALKPIFLGSTVDLAEPGPVGPVDRGAIDLMLVRPELEFSVARRIDRVGLVHEEIHANARFVDVSGPYCGTVPLPTTGPLPFDDPGVFPIPPEPEAVACPPDATFGGGEAVWLVSDANLVPLWRHETGLGQVAYEAETPGLADYQFGESYDLLIPGEEEGLPAIELGDVQPTVPGDYDLLYPDRAELVIPRNEPLTVRWTPAATYPDAHLLIYIHGRLVDEPFDADAAVLAWDDGEFTFEPSLLVQLAPGPAELELRSYVSGPTLALGSTAPAEWWRRYRTSSELVTRVALELE